MGTTNSIHKYYPFGFEVESSSDGPRLKFTGHERDETLELDYMRARACSSTNSRFLSVDPVLGDAPHPQSWNRYIYVLNNPMTFVDPDGREGLNTAELALILSDPMGGARVVVAGIYARGRSWLELGTYGGTGTENAVMHATWACESVCQAGALGQSFVDAHEDFGPNPGSPSSEMDSYNNAVGFLNAEDGACDTGCFAAARESAVAGELTSVGPDGELETSDPNTVATPQATATLADAAD